MNELILVNSAELVRQSTDIAGLCRDIVVATAIEIKGKKYVPVEAWQAIATAHGCIATIKSVVRTETGFLSVAELHRQSDGVSLSSAEGFVGDDEPDWSGRAEYARRAMAQTRAISRVCRGALAHIVVMMKAGLSTTPAEEVPHGGFTDNNGANRPAQLPQRPASDARASKPATDTTKDGITTMTGLVVKECKVKEGVYTKGESAGEKWYLHIVEFTDSKGEKGSSASTFEREIYDAALEIGKKQCTCTITIEPSKKAGNWKLLSIKEEPEDDKGAWQEGDELQ